MPLDRISDGVLKRAVRKDNPYHDDQGKFTNAMGVAEGAATATAHTAAESYHKDQVDHYGLMEGQMTLKDAYDSAYYHEANDSTVLSDADRAGLAALLGKTLGKKADSTYHTAMQLHAKAAAMHSLAKKDLKHSEAARAASKAAHAVSVTGE